MSTLPTFRYHPDSIATGSVKPSDKECRSCGEARGYIYTSSVYAEESLDEEICPWCIADGSAAEKFDASFCDANFTQVPIRINIKIAPLYHAQICFFDERS